MGFLSYENRQHFFLLEKNEGLLRRLRQLDRTGRFIAAQPLIVVSN
jgi:hypothetical protein